MKNKIRKILLYVSFLPYVFLILYSFQILILNSIFVAKNGYTYDFVDAETMYGLLAIKEYFLDYALIRIIYTFFNSITLIIILLSIGYQIYYFKTKHNKVKENFYNDSNIKRLEKSINDLNEGKGSKHEIVDMEKE